MDAFTLQCAVMGLSGRLQNERKLGRLPRVLFSTIRAAVAGYALGYSQASGSTLTAGQITDLETAVLQDFLAKTALSASPTSDIIDRLRRQRAWSERTFGPGSRAKGVVAHIRKELAEIEANPSDLEEWIDVVILALDGAWRTGATPEQIVTTWDAKQTKNESRQWPDWRTRGEDEAIEHVRES